MGASIARDLSRLNKRIAKGSKKGVDCNLKKWWGKKLIDIDEANAALDYTDGGNYHQVYLFGPGLKIGSIERKLFGRGGRLAKVP